MNAVTIKIPARYSALTLDIPAGGGYSPAYQGEYEVTPSQETQILSTRGLSMDRDVTINPIPNYYGLITWDGSTITVS